MEENEYNNNCVLCVNNNNVNYRISCLDGLAITYYYDQIPV